MCDHLLGRLKLLVSLTDNFGKFYLFQEGFFLAGEHGRVTFLLGARIFSETVFGKPFARFVLSV